MSGVLNWIKANLYTVVFIAIMIAAPVAMWVVSGKMNAAVRDEVQKRSGRISELNSLEKTTVKLDNPVPGNVAVNASVLVNRKLLDRFREVADLISKDAELVRARVLEVNQKGRGVLLDRLFPSPAEHERETLPMDMYLALRSAYERLLADLNAGSPPSLEAMREELEAAEARSRTQILMKEAREGLTAEEEAWLTEQLTKTRLAQYAEAARQISLYLTLDRLGVPTEAEIPVAAEGDGNVEMFRWQWDYWIVQDILAALKGANEPYDSVVEAPVKRLVSLTMLDDAAPSAARSANQGVGAPTGSFGTSGRSGRRSDSKSKSSGRSRKGSAGAVPNSSREVPLDYRVSFTGRTTNSLYDVRRVRLVIIADSARIPEVFDALARQNFFTILDVRVDSVDLFESVGGGYFYGSSSVSQLTIELETVWLREWTAPFMPDELKQLLGIPIPSDKG